MKVSDFHTWEILREFGALKAKQIDDQQYCFISQPPPPNSQSEFGGGGSEFAPKHRRRGVAELLVIN